MVEFWCMNDNYMGSRRLVPLHAAAQNKAESNDLQQDAAASTEMQLHALPSPEDFTISVEQVREHFRSKGVFKSKDTVQRWCRTGELTCQKRGVLNRYFTTEASLKELEQKILPDMIADTSGEAKLVQLDAAADTPAHTDFQLHAGEDTAARSGTPQHKDPEMQLHAAANSEPNEIIKSSSGLSHLEAENEGLRKQVELQNDQIEFLREEVRAARDQRGAVVQISNRMLETLETMAVGGRLDRPRQPGGSSQQSTDPVTMEQSQPVRDRV